MLNTIISHYRIVEKLGGGGWEWHPPQCVAFPTGDVDPPCSIFGNDSKMPKADNPESSTLTVRPGFVEFHTMQGKRITATW
jgi:hypothetical protein